MRAKGTSPQTHRAPPQQIAAVGSGASRLLHRLMRQVHDRLGALARRDRDTASGTTIDIVDGTLDSHRGGVDGCCSDQRRGKSYCPNAVMKR